ncbi:MAG: hypothetical protein KME30_02940 [Iphinoe sp. HA4291-MV1]|jgi:hypothetical protein|nr:hypothetical protein [Iphinoe sp. HA4291-MV1]
MRSPVWRPSHLPDEMDGACIAAKTLKDANQICLCLQTLSGLGQEDIS